MIHVTFSARARALLAVCCLAGCLPVSVPAPATFSAEDLAEVARTGEELKLHMLDGTAYLLTRWLPDSSRTDTIEGTGTLFGLDRQPISEGRFLVPRDSIVLAEIDRGREIHPFGFSWLATMTTVWGALTISCVADPKSCFGSCPTFYIDDIDPNRPRAEGFSSSIASSLESADLDDLRATGAGGDTVTITMKNEALETHAVRYARLVAAPLGGAALIVAGVHGSFFAITDQRRPKGCTSSDGEESCLAEISDVDANEFSPVTDSTDLSARQIVELTFENSGGANGIIIQGRQSFVSTYLIYQAMAFMGSEAGYWLAALERNDPTVMAAYDGLQRLTGSMDVFVQSSNGDWEYRASFTERGPIASDMKAVQLIGGMTGDTVRIRLEMAQGSWRIGYVALASLAETDPPLNLDPVSIRQTNQGGGTPASGQSLLDPTAHLVTQPGDSYELVYVLPDSEAGYQLFLESSGFYYEWMRGEWIEEENPGMVALMLNQPASALKVMAPGFKSLEASFEENFWASRFGTHGSER